MDGTGMRARRNHLGLTQAEFAKRLGLSRDYIGQMERGAAEISHRTAAAVQALRSLPAGPGARLQATDPMEQMIEAALVEAGVDFKRKGSNPGQTLDFYLPSFETYIEVKRFHSERIAAQMARVPNIIAAQGEPAVRCLAAAIRGGLFNVVAS